MPYLVESIMSKPAMTIDAHTRVADALDLMGKKNISSLVVNPTAPGDSYGILTKRDLITKVVARNIDPRHLFVSEIMSKPVIKISPQATLRECSILMSKAGVRRLPVFDDDKLVGIISDTDIFQCVEERGWESEFETTDDQDPFLVSLHSRVRAQLDLGTDADRIAAAITLAIGELYRALRK